MLTGCTGFVLKRTSNDTSGRSGEVETKNFRDPEGSPLSKQ